MSKIKWRRFSVEDFTDLKGRLQTADEIPADHGEYFGQVLIGDVCIDIEIDHLDCGRAQVDLCLFVPHENGTEAYREEVDGMAYDFIEQGVWRIQPDEFQKLDYETFRGQVEQYVHRLEDIPALATAMRNDTSFWEMHDALWLK